MKTRHLIALIGDMTPTSERFCPRIPRAIPIPDWIEINETNGTYRSKYTQGDKRNEGYFNIGQDYYATCLKMYGEPHLQMHVFGIFDPTDLDHLNNMLEVAYQMA